MPASSWGRSGTPAEVIVRGIFDEDEEEKRFMTSVMQEARAKAG
jgi:hypothetical protein